MSLSTLLKKSLGIIGVIFIFSVVITIASSRPASAACPGQHTYYNIQWSPSGTITINKGQDTSQDVSANAGVDSSACYTWAKNVKVYVSGGGRVSVAGSPIALGDIKKSTSTPYKGGVTVYYDTSDYAYGSEHTLCFSAHGEATYSGGSETGASSSICTKIKVNPAPAIPLPKCNSFTASPATIKQGDKSTLSWSTSGGTDWGIDPDLGGADIGASGNREVKPSSTTKYTLLVVNSAGYWTCDRTITVIPPPVTPPPPPPVTPPPPPPVTPYCSFSDAHRVDATRWSVTWKSYNYFGANLSGRLENSITGNTDNSVGLSKTDHRVQVADGQTGVIKFTMLNGGNPTNITCSINVGASAPTPPPPPPPPTQPPTFTCNAAPLTTDRNDNPWVTAFDAIPRGSVPPPPSSITVDPGQSVYVLGYIQKGTNPRIPGYVYKWTIDPSANTQGPNLKLNYQDNKAYVSFKVTAPNKPVTETYTLKADVNSEAGGIIGSSCSVTITVKSKPLAPAYYPWLQAKRGNVTALGKIIAQPVGSWGSRPSGSTEWEAEHVIMSYLVGGVAETNFCSTKKYGFGVKDSSPCAYDDAGYKINTSFGGGSDVAVVSLDNAVNKRNGVDKATCSPEKKVPYKVVAYSGNLEASLASADATCPVVIAAAGDVTLGAATVASGRGTLFVDGNVTITGNIAYGYLGSYASINMIPNLGIVATGKITISPSVTNIDASLYAAGTSTTGVDPDKGRVMTCSSYPSASCSQRLVIRGKLAAANGFKLGRNYWAGSGIPDSPESAELVIGSGLLEAFPPPGFIDITKAARNTQNISTEANPRF